MSTSNNKELACEGGVVGQKGRATLLIEWLSLVVCVPGGAPLPTEVIVVN